MSVFLARQVQIPTGGLPAGYTRLDYIQASGTQYIDTGFKPNQDTRALMEVYPISTTPDGTCLFGSRISYQNTDFSTWILTSQIYSGFANEAKLESFNPIQEFILDKNKNIQTTGTITLTNASATFQSNLNAYLFACNQNGSAVYHSSTKCYYCKIYDNGTLVRDFIPCKNANNVVGLYDLVNKEFYTNAGSGSFTGG